MGELQPGATVGERFEVLGVLGRGGMATVYLASDRVRGERVALKVLHDHLAHDPAMRTRLQREVQAAGLIRSDAVLVAHELHDLDGILAVSLPFHPGRTLEERVAAEGPLPPEEVKALGIRLATALSEAHRHGVLHRDVTPGNVMVDDAGRAVLTDFGLARVRDSRAAKSTGLVGTTGYTAPEVYEGVRADPRSDLYGLGAVLAFAATGKPPFSGRDPAEVIHRQLQGEPPPLPDLPAPLARTIRALLQRDPELRPQSGGEVLDALEHGVTPERPRAAAWPGGGEGPPDREVALPAGTQLVVAKRREGGRASVRHLADAIARVAGLPPGSLTLGPAAEEERFKVVNGVDAYTATRLVEAAEAAGFGAEAIDLGSRTPLHRLRFFWWLPIPLMWVAFPFLLTAGANVLILLPVLVIATILLGSIGPFVMPPEVPEGLGLACERDLRAHLAPGVQLPEPARAETGEETRSRGRILADRTLDRLAVLDAAIEGATALPEPARRDLRATLSGLRATAEGLGKDIERMEAALSERDPDLEAEWVVSRLDRLDTLARAGEAVDEEERVRLRRALARYEESVASRAELEARLTANIAQLLEVGATAMRTRREVLLEGAEPGSAERLVRRLEREAVAAVEARAETEHLQRARAATRRIHRDPGK